MFFTPEPTRWPLNRRRGHAPAPIQPNPRPLPGPGIPPTDWRIPMSPRAGLNPTFPDLLRPLVLPDTRSPHPRSPGSPSPWQTPLTPFRWQRDHVVRGTTTRYFASASNTILKDIDRLETPRNFLPSLSAVLHEEGTPTPTAHTWPPATLTAVEPMTALLQPACRTRTQSVNHDAIDASMASQSARDNRNSVEASPASAKSSTSGDSSDSGDTAPMRSMPGRFTESLDVSATAEWFERHLSIDSGYEADSEQELYEVEVMRATRSYEHER